MSAGRQGQAKAVLSEVQTRHDDIKHIEKTIIVRQLQSQRKKKKMLRNNYRNYTNFLWICP